MLTSFNFLLSNMTKEIFKYCFPLEAKQFCLLQISDALTTHRDFHTPELSSHLAGHLQCNFGSHSHECLRAAECTGHHTLAGSGAVHAQVLLDGVVFVLPVAGKHHYHLTNGKQWNVL